MWRPISSTRWRSCCPRTGAPGCRRGASGPACGCTICSPASATCACIAGWGAKGRSGSSPGCATRTCKARHSTSTRRRMTRGSPSRPCVLPRADFSYIGTTDTDEDTSPDDVRATGEDAIYLLRSANWFFPTARLSPRDVVATWAGLRPLLRAGALDVAPSATSREHRVVEGPGGLLTIAGGKLTTYRLMARDVVDRVAARLHALDGRPRAPRAPTDRPPPPGGEAADREGLG